MQSDNTNLDNLEQIVINSFQLIPIKQLVTKNVNFLKLYIINVLVIINKLILFLQNSIMILLYVLSLLL